MVGMLTAGHVVFHPDQAEAVAEGKHSVDTQAVETRPQGMRPDNHLYSSDMKRPRTARLAEELELWEALEHRGSAAKR
jgi:hypothetical protein